MLSFYKTSIAALAHVSRLDAACFVFIAFAVCLGIYGLLVYRKTFGEVTNSRDYSIYNSSKFEKLSRDDAMAVTQRITRRFLNQAERKRLQKTKKLDILEARINRMKKRSDETAEFQAKMAKTSFASLVAQRAIEIRTIRLIAALVLATTFVVLGIWTEIFSLRIATLCSFVLVVDATDILVLSARLSTGCYGENEVDVLQAAEYVISKTRQGGGGPRSFGEVFQKASVPEAGPDMPEAEGEPA